MFRGLVSAHILAKYDFYSFVNDLDLFQNVWCDQGQGTVNLY